MGMLLSNSINKEGTRMIREGPGRDKSPETGSVYPPESERLAGDVRFKVRPRGDRFVKVLKRPLKNAATDRRSYEELPGPIAERSSASLG